MKKILTVLLIVVLAMSAVIALVACDGGEKSEVEKAIEAAQNMTLEELVAAAKKELADNPTLKFNADSLTSGVKKALPEFAKEYGLDADRLVYNSKKGSEYQPKLNAAYSANSYIADWVMIQDASFVKSLADEKFLLSYVPQGDDFQFDAKDTSPMVGVTFNKIFMYYNQTVGKDAFKNVWQLTGVDSKDGTLKASKLSYQNPLGEDVNMSFLIMLTSPEACTKLEAAYEKYFGEKYDASKDDYENIGYKFVAELISNVKYWHGSDTDEVKAISTYSQDARIIFAGLCKVKDYAGYKKDATYTPFKLDEKGKKQKAPAGTPENEIDKDGYWLDVANAVGAKFYKDGITAAGYNNDVEGFPGFVYNMWTLIPSTAKLPYTACLFTRYLLTQKGFEAGFGGIVGYYSANQKINANDDDKALSVWKQKAIVEDVEYINSVYGTAVKFINQKLAGK